MAIDMKALFDNLLNIAEKAAPLVGLSDEVQAGKALVEAIKGAVDNVGEAFDSTDMAALQSQLDALFAKVDAHAAKTIDSLD